MQDKTIEIEILVTLEEILTGVRFDYKIPRRIFDKKGRVVYNGELSAGKRKACNKVGFQVDFQSGGIHWGVKSMHRHLRGRFSRFISMTRRRFPEEPHRRGNLSVNTEVLPPDQQCHVL